MHNAREIAVLVPMPRLLGTLGFIVNERTRRAPCPLHGGSNPTAFAWREDGRWRCFSCGESGDRIALVRAVRRCGFREAVKFLAALAGVEYRARHVLRREGEQARHRRKRVERSAWDIRDEVLRLRLDYLDALHRAERLQRCTGENILRASNQTNQESAWDRLARLAPVSTYFLAAWCFISDAPPALLTRFVLSEPAERRSLILGETDADIELHAA